MMMNYSNSRYLHALGFNSNAKDVAKGISGDKPCG